MTYITNTKYRPQLAEQRERMKGEDMHVKGVGTTEEERFLVHTAVGGVTLDALAEGTVSAGCLCGVSQMGASLLKSGTLM